MEQNESGEEKVQASNNNYDKKRILSLTDEIKDKLTTEKKDILDFIKDQINIIEKKYDTLITSIPEIISTEINYIENNIKDDASKNIEYRTNADILNNILAINCIMKGDIQRNFGLLNNFLEQKFFQERIIKKENKTKTLTQEVISIINKPYFNKYKKNDNTLSKLKIKNSENINDFQKLLDYSDLLKIEQITMKNLNPNDINTLYPEGSEIRQVLQNNKNDNADNKIICDLIFKNCILDSINLSQIFPNILNLYISNSQLPFEINEILNLSSLITLKLENIGLISENFDHLFKKMRENEQLKKNLKILSIKNNNISILDLTRGLADNEIVEVCGFINLEEFDISCNKLSHFDIKVMNGFKKIKIIDITNNCMNYHQSWIESIIGMSKKKFFLLLATKNPWLFKPNERKSYINYLFDIIPKIDYELSNVSLINLYSGENYNKMLDLNLNKFNNSLQELDLSFGNLKDEDLINVFGKNIPVNCLKKLVLISNNLTGKFLELLVDKKLNDKFLKLKELNLSNNEINFKTIEKFKLFLESFKFLKLLTLKHTPIELYINNYLKNKILRHYEHQMKKTIKTEYSNIDLEIQKLMDPESENYLAKNTNTSLEIIDLNNGKYTTKIKKYYPTVLERVDVEIKFFDPN